eukprot:510122_1
MDYINITRDGLILPLWMLMSIILASMALGMSLGPCFIYCSIRCWLLSSTESNASTLQSSNTTTLLVIDSDQINKKNQNIRINRNVFYDKSPKTNPYNKYFICRNASNKSNLSVLIPMYNEHKFAIESSLLSLFESLAKLQNLVVDIIIILDGWNKADISTKMYFQQIFKFNESDITNNEHKKHKNYVFQTAHFSPICFSKNDY